MTVGMLGLIVELRTPGFGVPGALGLMSLGLFFWGHWLVQLAGWEELLLVGLGLVLLALEVFVIPGFGLPGLLGLAALLGGLGLSVVGAGATWGAILASMGWVALCVLLALAASRALLRVLPRLSWGRRLILETELLAGPGGAAAPEHDRRWLSKSSTAVTPLRPAGIASLDGERVDVVAEGAFIEVGQAIDVIRVDGNRVVVRQSRAPNAKE
jgi:membrane-bound serine protease (ClpP class)